MHNDQWKHLVVGHESGAIDIWDATEARSKRQVKAHDYRANLISFTLDGKLFFSNSYFEESTKLWSAKTGELLLTIPETRGPVCATPDDDIYLITTSDSSTVRFFDLARKALLPETYTASGVVQTMAMDRESKQIAIGTASGTIEVWTFSRVGEQLNLKKTADAKPYSTGNWVVGLHFIPGGQRLYSVASSGVIDEWDSATLKKQRSLPATIRIQSATFLQNTSLVALAGAVDKQGTQVGFVELISLSTGTANKFRANYNFPVIEFLPSLSSLMVAEYLSTQVYPIKTN
ncbi:MAG: WD40 repeat domain-containing protein [Nitrospira sp.]|nr:MAG: WD40 repeat domain-containing protein [Nitrospira sp.]